VGDRLHAGRVCPLAGDGTPQRPGWLGTVRLLCLPLALLLGPAPAHAGHLARPAHRFRAHRAKADERQVLLDILAADPNLASGRPGQVLIGDKHYYGRDFEAHLAAAGIRLLRPARQGEPARAGARFFKPDRQTIESIFDSYKGQLDLERHGGKTPQGVLVRVLQRILALTAAIWHNDHSGQPITRSLLAYDH
jgi:hypothetical protein